MQALGQRIVMKRSTRTTMVLVFGRMLALAISTFVMYRRTRAAHEKLITGGLEHPPNNWQTPCLFWPRPPSGEPISAARPPGLPWKAQLTTLAGSVFLQATRITRPIIHLRAVIARPVWGDLRPSEGSVLRLLSGRDELGAMSHEIRRMWEGPAGLAGAIHAECSAVGTPGNAAQAAGGVAPVVTQQALAADEVCQTMAEYRATIQQIAFGAER
jgi:methyl-accepting chemotaxis protein